MLLNNLRLQRIRLHLSNQRFLSNLMLHRFQKNQSNQTDFPGSFSWNLEHGLPVTEEQLKSEQLTENATIEFERAFSFGKLPWYTKTGWERFRKWVIERYQEDATCFQDYVEWREDPNGGKFGKAVSNVALRKEPQLLIDTWPAFASIHKKEEPNWYKPREVETKPMPEDIRRELRQGN